MATPANSASDSVRRKTAAAERRSALPRWNATSDCVRKGGGRGPGAGAERVSRQARWAGASAARAGCWAAAGRPTVRPSRPGPRLRGPTHLRGDVHGGVGLVAEHPDLPQDLVGCGQGGGTSEARRQLGFCRAAPCARPARRPQQDCPRQQGRTRQAHGAKAGNQAGGPHQHACGAAVLDGLRVRRAGEPTGPRAASTSRRWHHCSARAQQHMYQAVDEPRGVPGHALLPSWAKQAQPSTHPWQAASGWTGRGRCAAWAPPRPRPAAAPGRTRCVQGGWLGWVGSSAVRGRAGWRAAGSCAAEVRALRHQASPSSTGCACTIEAGARPDPRSARPPSPAHRM